MEHNENKKMQQNLFVRALIEEEKRVAQERRAKNKRDIMVSKQTYRNRPKGGQG